MTEIPTSSGVERLYLLYHELRPESSRYSYVMSSERFAQQAALFARLHREPGTSLLPELTFDDGHRSDHQIALPILAQHGITARFFITADWTDQRAGYMTATELRELHRAGQVVGAHGWSHALLTQCAEAQLRSELGDAKSRLEDVLGAVVDTLSLPGGRGNRRVFAACREMGYRQVYTSQPRAEADPAAPRIGRLNLRGDTTLPWIADLLAPDRALLGRLIRGDRLKQAGKHLLGDALYGRLWKTINRAEGNTDPAGAEPR